MAEGSEYCRCHHLAIAYVWACQLVAPSSREIPRAASSTAAVKRLAMPRGKISSVAPTISVARWGKDRLA